MAMSSLPKISVVIFSYNFARYLGECIESMLAQTLHPFEIIICDDHSLDDSWTIISEYSQRYPELIKAYRQERNIGPAHNGNFGLKRARGGLITWLDGDDRWLPRKLELEWKALQRHPDAQIAYSNVYAIDADGNRTGIWHDDEGPAPPTGDVFIEVFSRRFFSNTISLFRNHLRYSSTSDEVGYMDENLESMWDWDEKIRLTARFPVAYSGEALVERRGHDEGFSRTAGAATHTKASIKVYEKNLPLLTHRSPMGRTLVKCRIESFLARLQSELPPSERLDYYSPRSVYERSRALVESLPKDDRTALREELSILFAKPARRAAMKEMEKGNRRVALEYWLKSLQYDTDCSGLRLLPQLMLPSWAYQRLEKMYRSLRDIRR